MREKFREILKLIDAKVIYKRQMRPQEIRTNAVHDHIGVGNDCFDRVLVSCIILYRHNLQNNGILR